MFSLEEEALSPKKEAMFLAVASLMEEGVDINELTVAAITKRAGIGKGTAYEYFSSKEELISDAVLYNLNQSIKKLFAHIFAQKTLQERTNFILQMIDDEMKKKNCCMSFYSLLSGNVAVNIAIREKLQQCSMQTKPSAMLEKLVERGVEEGLIRSDVPAKFLGYQSFSRVMSYVTFLNMEPDASEKEKKEMRDFIAKQMVEEMRNICV